MASAPRSLVPALAVCLAALLAGCGPANPVLGDWEIDHARTRAGAAFAVEAAGLETLSFDRSGARSGDTHIPGEWVIEEGGRVQLVRQDGRGSHPIEVVSEDEIRVSLPIGVSAFYRRKE
jgi:hypothetical protein